MRPQDPVILLKIAHMTSEDWLLKDLASALYISNSEISESLERSVYANLIDFEKRNIHRGNLTDFLIHGMKYVFPASPGVITRGIATAHSHSFMKKFIDSTHAYVWPASSGTIIGQAIEPFYSNQVNAIQHDEKLYQSLALLDVIRVGRVREVSIAVKALTEILSHA